MGEVIGQKSIKHAAKDHACEWCGERIEAGQPYESWLWCEGGTVSQVKAHPECRSAWDDAASEEGGIYETGFGEHSRGCRCEAGACECEMEVKHERPTRIH
jgi:hypothetical protein